MCDMVGQYIQKKEEEKQIKEEQVAKARYWKIPVCYDDDDEDYTIAITPKEPDNSLSMRDEHLDTISATKSDEFIKSSVKHLVPNPSESEGEHECDVPVCEVFTTFSNIFFDADYDFSSSDDQSFSDEDIPKKIYSNPLFDKEIFSIKIDPHHFNAKSDLIESLLNHDSSIIYSFSKIDSLFDEFAGELTLLKSIPPRINETDCDPEEETGLIKRLLYDNSSPHPPKEFISENYDTAFESFSPFHIPVEDSDTLMEEIDLSFTPDDPMPPGIEEDDYDSERDILILEELLSNDSLSLPENESFHFDIPSSSRPPAKPPDGNSGILNIKVMGDTCEHKYSRNLKTHAKGFLLQSLFPQLHLGIILSIRESSRRTKNDSVKLEAYAKQGLFENPKSHMCNLCLFLPLAITLKQLRKDPFIKGSTSETDKNATNPPQVPPTPQAPHTLSNIKLLVLKKRFYRIIFCTQNVAFVTSDSTSSTNEVNAAYGVDEFDLEEMDLKWQVAMISTRLKKFYKKTRRKLHFDAKEPVGFDKNKVECFNCHNARHFARECRSKGNQKSRKKDARNTRHKARDNGRRPAKQDKHKAMVTIDGEGVGWTAHAKDDTEDYALMAFNSSNSGSDTEVTKDEGNDGVEVSCVDAYLCGREANFDLTIGEKDELSKLSWDNFLIMTHFTINNKNIYYGDP
nr:ribonuclease H-like domain-containing protein [Tanacetum cinerariifolium]